MQHFYIIVNFWILFGLVIADYQWSRKKLSFKWSPTSGDDSLDDNVDAESDEDECVNFNPPLHALNLWPNYWMNIFTDYSFQCSGYITAWDFYALKPGYAYLSIWRPISNKKAVLVGKNKITATRRGKQTWNVPTEDQIEVQERDLLGIYYDEDSNNRRTGIIPLESSQIRPTYDVNHKDLSRVILFAAENSALTIGTEIDLNPYPVKRMPALRPQIDSLS